jgi:hypothetical protein
MSIKGMKLTSVERIGRSQLIPGVLRTKRGASAPTVRDIPPGQSGSQEVRRDMSQVAKTPSGRSRSRLARWAVGGAILCVAVLASYVALFAVEFEIGGPAVRDNVHGWLGPTPRGTRCVHDIGKVNYWVCADVSMFQRYRLGCRVWLRANGFDG